MEIRGRHGIFLAVALAVGCVDREPSETHHSSSVTGGSEGTTSEGTTSEGATSEETTSEETTSEGASSDSDGTGENCLECESCGGGFCVLHCNDSSLLECETICLEELSCSTSPKVNICDCEQEICGSSLSFKGFGERFTPPRRCIDFVCSISATSICTDTNYADCDFSSQGMSCEDGQKCAPIDVHGLPSFDWVTCIDGGGELKPGEKCTNYVDHDECEEGAACHYGTCLPLCSQNMIDCPSGYQCALSDGWIPFCFPL